MQPKDLLEHLEKGDRRLEMLAGFAAISSQQEVEQMEQRNYQDLLNQRFFSGGSQWIR